MKAPMTWSFSRLSTYRKCPQQFKYQFIDKLPAWEVEPPAMARGNVIHKMLESAVTGPKLAVTKEFKGLMPELARIRKLNPRAELSLAFTAEWKPCGWMDPKVRCRIKIDVAFGGDNITLLDYKSGKVKPEEHVEQLQLYALAWLLIEDERPQSLVTGAWYVDYEKEARPLTVYDHPNDKTLSILKRYWEKETSGLVKDTKFLPRPDRRICAWCPYSKFKGGPCKKAAA